MEELHVLKAKPQLSSMATTLMELPGPFLISPSFAVLKSNVLLLLCSVIHPAEFKDLMINNLPTSLTFSISSCLLVRHRSVMASPLVWSLYLLDHKIVLYVS